jgi:hypothetical protein
MEFVTQLWMPIAVSAVLVFIASSVIHMVLKWHKSDYNQVANEEGVRAALRSGNATPAQYMVPYCGDMKDLKTPEMQKKFTEGPIAFITLRPPGPPAMGSAMGLWFAYTVVVSAIAAYVVQKVLGPEANFLQVCRVVGALSFLAYAGGSVPQGIWMGKPWGSVAKEIVDGAIYAAITACVFAWLWHH